MRHVKKTISAREFKRILMRAYYGPDQITDDELDYRQIVAIVTQDGSDGDYPAMLFVTGTPPKGTYFGWGYVRDGRIYLRAPYRYNNVHIDGDMRKIPKDLDALWLEIVPDAQTVIYTYDPFAPGFSLHLLKTLQHEVFSYA